MKKAAKEAERVRQQQLAEEDRRRRYEIVDHVRSMQDEKEACVQKSVVQEVAEKAQAEF